MITAIIIHTDEINLKGGNRKQFERTLAETISNRIRPLGDFKLIYRKGLTLITHKNGTIDDDLKSKLTDMLGTVFGIAYFFYAVETESSINAISSAATAIMTPHAGKTFRVTARRADKSFPMTSMEIAREIGGTILQIVPNMTVDLHNPETTLKVEIIPEGTFVGAERIEGPGGLPTGTQGRVAAMLSGGIDSPVAAWKLMRRGCRVIFVHFHSYPYVSNASLEKVKRLAKILDRFQGKSRLYMVPFGDIQRQITAETDERMRVILYRRFMIRIAERLGRKDGTHAIVTGDAVGQVASQTLENIETVNDAATLPVFRPIIGEDKRDISTIAQNIGTYETSIEPHDDCCTLFVPDKPELRANPERAHAEESKLNVEALIAQAIDATERIDI